MKKLLTILLAVVATASIYSQDTNLVYSEGGMIRIEGIEANTILLTPNLTNIKLNRSDFILKDGITKNEFNIGYYAEIFTKDTVNFSTQDSTILYLSRLLNNQASRDEITSVSTSIDYGHHEIHSGSTFRVQAFNDAIPATGSNGELVIGFYVPDQSKKPHLIFDFVHEGDMTIKVLENTTLTLGTGTDISCKNSNRSSSKTSVLQGVETGALVSGYVTKNPTYTGGDIISLKRNYAARNEATSGSRRNEIILKPGTQYVFILDNNQTSTQGGQIRLEWYEHTDKY